MSGSIAIPLVAEKWFGFSIVIALLLVVFVVWEVKAFGVRFPMAYVVINFSALAFFCAVSLYMVRVNLTVAVMLCAIVASLVCIINSNVFIQQKAL